MEQTIISVIVPCYNVEKYLPKCIDSILRQTYQNLEVNSNAKYQLKNASIAIVEVVSYVMNMQQKIKE